MIKKSSNFLIPRVYLKKRVILLFAFLFLSFQVCYAQDTVARTDRHGGRLVLSATSDPNSFNAILAKETSTTTVTNYIFEGLTTTDTFSLKVKPNLAKEWDVSDDGLTWTFYLRDDVLWSDGKPFTSDDVIFTFNDLIYNPDIPSSASDIFNIEGKPFKVEKVDDLTVKFTLPLRYAPFLRGMGQSILPAHKLRRSVEEGKFNFTWGIDTDPSEIVGTGPYKLTEYHPGERLVFERNDKYWKKSSKGDDLPYIDKIIYIIVQNADTSLLKFMDGELDYYGLRGIDYPLLKPLEEKRRFTVYDVGPAFGTNFITFNQNTGSNPKTEKPFVDPVKLTWFRNLQFRKAVAHSIDKKKIIDILMNGLGYSQSSAMSPSAGFFYNAKVEIYDYDLKKAKEILEKAGFKDRNGDGIIEDKKGNDIKFNLYTNSGAVERVQIASIIRHDLQELGMKVNFLALEFNSIVDKLTSSFEWDSIILGLTGGIEPNFGKNVWISSGHLHLWFPRQKKPSTRWEKRLDRIFDLGVQELNEDKRKILYDEFQKIVSQKVPLVYTVLNSNIFAIRDKFGNLQPASYGGAFHNIEEIYVKPEYK